jgi:hypothetical protein
MQHEWSASPPTDSFSNLQLLGLMPLKEKEHSLIEEGGQVEELRGELEAVDFPQTRLSPEAKEQVT